jgi:hypothetical protein
MTFPTSVLRRRGPVAGDTTETEACKHPDTTFESMEVAS